MDVPWKVLFAFVGVFIAGAIFGGVFTIGVSARKTGNGQRAERQINQLPPAKQPPKTVVLGPQLPGAQARNNPVTHQLMTQFTRRLNPTAEQKEELRKVLGRAGEDLQRLRKENFDDVARVTERMYADVSAVLTLDQRGELEKMRKQVEERMQNDRKKRAEMADGKNAVNASPAPVRPNNAPALTP